MQFKVVALDYDGTIAHEGRLEPEIRTVLESARTRGIYVVLVTGRILRDLMRVAGSLDFADAVVTENGGVLSFPHSGRQQRLATPPPAAFLDALRARSLQVTWGDCVVEADGALGMPIQALVRQMELPLTLHYNRGRLMVLPQGISKASGLEAALRALRLSARNTLAIGDAENDHALLQSAEIGVAVGWGSAPLQAAADVVIEGESPRAVARFLQEQVETASLPRGRGRRQIELGRDAEGALLSLAILGRNVQVTGEPRSGKSHVAGLLAEQLILQGYTVCVIDPEGDHVSLQALPGVIALGLDEPPPSTPEILRLLAYPDLSVVVDLSKLPHPEKVQRANQLLRGLESLRQRCGLPHRVLVDEAHYFLQPGAGPLAPGVDGYTLVSYRPTDLIGSPLGRSEIHLVTRTSDPASVAALARVAGVPADEAWAARLATLPQGQMLLLPTTEEGGGTVREIRIAPRLTPHVRHKQKYMDIPVEARRAFVFSAPDGTATGIRAASLGEFTRLVEQVPDSVLAGHLARRDVSRWVRGVFFDPALAGRLQEIERAATARPASESRALLNRAICDRYGSCPPLARMTAEGAGEEGASG